MKIEAIPSSIFILLAPKMVVFYHHDKFNINTHTFKLLISNKYNLVGSLKIQRHLLTDKASNARSDNSTDYSQIISNDYIKVPRDGI